MNSHRERNRKGSFEPVNIRIYTKNGRSTGDYPIKISLSEELTSPLQSLPGEGRSGFLAYGCRSLEFITRNGVTRSLLHRAFFSNFGRFPEIIFT